MVHIMKNTLQYGCTSFKKLLTAGGRTLRLPALRDLLPPSLEPLLLPRHARLAVGGLDDQILELPPVRKLKCVHLYKWRARPQDARICAVSANYRLESMLM